MSKGRNYECHLSIGSMLERKPSDAVLSNYVRGYNLLGVNNRIAQGVNVNGFVQNYDPISYLSFSARAGQNDICKSLLEAKADPAFRCHDHDWVAFDYACFYGHYEIAKMFAYVGVKLTLRWRDKSAQHVASRIRQSKKYCVAILTALYGAMKIRWKQNKDTTQIIMRMVWEKRFDF